MLLLQVVDFFVFSEIMRTYAREYDQIWKKQFSRVLSHDLYEMTWKQNIKAKEVY